MERPIRPDHRSRLSASLGLFFAGLFVVGVPAVAGNAVADWLLPADHFIPAKMPMTVVHPRNAHAPGWSYARNAHPGIRWEIPIVIQGGAWPFRYELVDNGGASGLAIGGELARRIDHGYVVHERTSDYGRLWWQDPIAGNYSILVRVHDQGGTHIDVPLSLAVGTAGWVFVDANDGSDEAGDGSVAAPFRTIRRIHDAGAAFADHRVYLSGVVPMDGNHPSGDLAINRGDFQHTPAVWVGKPGGNAVLEAYQGRISLTAPDFYFANLEHRHHVDFVQSHGSYIHMITAWGNTARLTLHDVHFSRFHGNPVNADLGNSSIIMFTDQGSPRSHVAIVNNTISGDNGIFTSAYQLHHSVVENNRAVNARFVTGDTATWAVFWIKRANEHLSIRGNEFWDGNFWGSPGNLSAALGMDAARTIEFAYNTVHTSYDGAGDRHGAIKLFTLSSLPNYSWTTSTPVWLYRNSLRHRLNFEGDNLVNMPNGNVITERNVLEPRAWPSHAFLLNIDNLDAGSYFDASMRLAGPARDAYLGRYGAEIAVALGDSLFSDGFD
ncbi:MAG: hypothetical protein KF823_10580 [Xanthomonadales bacterium]|nr:hypothetical protein [Xanthomonadales bacterium]